MYRYIRHPNYLGEIMIYGSFALMVRHWLPVVVLACVWTGLFAVNMINKEASMSRYPEWEEYKRRSWWLLPPVLQTVKPWTVELKDRSIRSNVLSPGPTETPAIGQQPADAIARIVSTIPMGRMGEADEIAKAALFLASDDSSFVTGIELFVDGGRAQV
jgi:hypothetical protein